MTKQKLALLAIDDAIAEATATVKSLEKARALARQGKYSEAQLAVSDANSSASYVDQIRCRNARSALEGCRE